MSLSSKRKRAKEMRRTLSGRWVARDYEGLPMWHEIVARPGPYISRVRDSAWYCDMAEIPTPESLRVILEGTEFNGLNRRQRRGR